MQHFENCRTLGTVFNGKPRNIITGSSIIFIDYAANWEYWTDRLNEQPTATATDRDGVKYTIYTNPARGLATAIPEGMQ